MKNMKLIKKSDAAAAVALLVFAANSGHADSTNAPASGRYASVTSEPYGFTVGAEPCTLGAGVAANWRFADHLGIGGGFDHARITGNRKINGVAYGATVRFMSEPLTLDLYPWKKSSFRVSAGVMFNQFDLNGTA